MDGAAGVWVGASGQPRPFLVPRVTPASAALVPGLEVSPARHGGLVTQGGLQLLAHVDLGHTVVHGGEKIDRQDYHHQVEDCHKNQDDGRDFYNGKRLPQYPDQEDHWQDDVESAGYNQQDGGDEEMWGCHR